MLLSARPKTTHTDPNHKAAIAEKARKTSTKTILNATSVTVFFNLVKNQRINQSKLKQNHKEEKRTQNKSVQKNAYVE